MLLLNSTDHLTSQAANVLLKSGNTGDQNSFVAKVMDFGLSVSLDVGTHVSSLVAGTASHMSPEILMEGKQTKAADVYAFVSPTRVLSPPHGPRLSPVPNSLSLE